MSLTRAAQEFAEALLEDDPVALYDRAPCGYVTTLPDGVVMKVNSTFLTLTGYAEEELLGRHLVDLLTPGGRIFYETHYAPLLRLQDSVHEIALDVVRKDQKSLPVLLNASVDRDEAGGPRLIRVAIFEATERRRYERELLRATEVAQEAQRHAEAATLRSRAMVETLQATLVPRTLPQVDGLELAGVYRPAGNGQEVGGDFYDAFTLNDDECWLVLGDVSGKGVEAAVVTALVRNGTRALAMSLLEHRREPAEILRMLDHLLTRDETDRFCTAAILRLRRRREGDWSTSYATGGHPPMLHRSSDGVSRFLECEGTLLGLDLSGEFEQCEGTLARGDTLLLYTDGVTEARGDSGLYGEERLLESARSGSRGSETVAAILDDLLRFSQNDPRDDIACLAVTAT